MSPCDYQHLTSNYIVLHLTNQFTGVTFQIEIHSNVIRINKSLSLSDHTTVPLKASDLPAATWHIALEHN